MKALCLVGKSDAQRFQVDDLDTRHPATIMPISATPISATLTPWQGRLQSTALVAGRRVLNDNSNIEHSSKQRAQGGADESWPTRI